MSQHLSWLEAGVIGALQGVSELFPVSSLGHSVLIPAMIGGSWARDLNVSAPESPYLAFIVGLHVATAWRSSCISGGTGNGSSPDCSPRSPTADQQRRTRRLAWLLILATIPVGITGLLLEHLFRTVLSKPDPTAVFLMINGLGLVAIEQWRRSREPARALVRGELGSARGRGDSGRCGCGAARWPPEPRRATGEPTPEEAVGDRRAAGPAERARSGPDRRQPDPGPAPRHQPIRLGHDRGTDSTGWTTRTPRGSRSCSPPRSSWPPVCSSCPIWPARSATASADRSCSAACSRSSAPTPASGS